VAKTPISSSGYLGGDQNLMLMRADAAEVAAIKEAAIEGGAQYYYSV
jgi:hypothetical protein